MTDWNQTPPPNPNPPAPSTLEQRVRETAAAVEVELQQLSGYVNDQVVPEVRRNGSAALKRAAEELNRLAGRMDAAGDHTPPSGSPRR